MSLLFFILGAFSLEEGISSAIIEFIGSLFSMFSSHTFSV